MFRSLRDEWQADTAWAEVLENSFCSKIVDVIGHNYLGVSQTVVLSTKSSKTQKAEPYAL